MTTAVEAARDYAQRYPLLIALGSILAIPGGFLLLSGKTTLLHKEPFLSKSASSTFVPGSTATSPICIAYDTFVFEPAVSRPVDEPVTAIIYRLIASTRNALRTIASRSGGRHHPEVRHETPNFAFDLPLSIVVIGALPSVFVFFLRHLPIPWATKHQTFIASVLHSVTIFFCAKRGLEAYHLLLLVFVMVAFDLFQQAVGLTPADAIPSESGDSSPQTSPLETPDTETRSTLANASTAVAVTRDLLPTLAQRSNAPDTALITFDAKDREIVRLQRALTELKTTHKATEVQLRVAREELLNARETLNGTFAEYANLREELKIIKQNLGRDHQAIVYRKDIELFALRKGNEQKDQHIRERDAKIEDMARQHKAAIEVKDAQLKLMKERIISVERQSSPKFSDDGDDGDHALEVRLLRVRKGRNSPIEEDDKDLIITKLQEQLAAIPTINEEVVNHRAELSRAWDVAKKIKKALLEERERHSQTQEKLQEATVKLSEADLQLTSQGNHSFSRLPTIEENDHDKNELEAMLNTAQEDNVRLYAEVAALEQRLADANSRMFAVTQETEALREGSNLEKSLDQDKETARPSLVHQVHFQRMEVQLVELRRTLKVKEEEAKKLKKTIADKDQHINEIQAELDAAASFHTQDQDEIERLKQCIAELQATKYQLMLDRERLVMHRPRQRIISSERTDRTSARSSGTTLIQELSAPSTAPSEDESSSAPMAQEVEMPEREGSIQETPKRHLRAKSLGRDLNNKWSLMSHDLPPPELREEKGMRIKSKSFKDVLQRMVGNKSQESHVRRALASRDSNAPMRPSTAASIKPPKPVNQPASIKLATSPVPPNVRATTPKPKPKTLSQQQRYYAAQDATLSETEDPMRPQSVGATSARKPKSIYGWSATRKLKRRSLM